MASRDPGFIRWFLVTFSTRAHFMRFIATLIVLASLYHFIFVGDVHDGLLTLVGMVLGYYFKPHGPNHED